jgi:hypothetical protein
MPYCSTYPLSLDPAITAIIKKKTITNDQITKGCFSANGKTFQNFSKIMPNMPKKSIKSMTGKKSDSMCQVFVLFGGLATPFPYVSMEAAMIKCRP